MRRPSKWSPVRGIAAIWMSLDGLAPLWNAMAARAHSSAFPHRRPAGGWSEIPTFLSYAVLKRRLTKHPEEFA